VVFSVAGVLAVVLVVLLYKRRRVKATLSSKASAIAPLYEAGNFGNSVRPAMQDFGDDDQNHLL
jgi:hypothetical protein